MFTYVVRRVLATIPVMVVVALFGVSLFTTQKTRRISPPTDDEIFDAQKAIAAQTSSGPNLLFLRDKAVIFDAERRAFVMYGIQGSTWVALGDPVGHIKKWSTSCSGSTQRTENPMVETSWSNRRRSAS